jgi:hypothetical protein
LFVHCCDRRKNFQTQTLTHIVELVSVRGASRSIFEVCVITLSLSIQAMQAVNSSSSTVHNTGALDKALPLMT